MTILFYIYYVAIALCQGISFDSIKSIRGRIKKDKNIDLLFKGKARIFDLELTGSGRLIIDEGVEIRSLYAHIGKDATVIISKGAFIGKDVKIICYGNIFIGEESLISPNVIILDNDHTLSDNNIKSSGLSIEDTTIEQYCWVGAGSIVCKGARLSKGSVLGAMSLLNKQTDSDSLYFGQPAIKKRDI